jgi:hypothetical protein
MAMTMPKFFMLICGCWMALVGDAISQAPAEPMELFLLIGQSNMAGRGEVTEQDRQPHPRVYALDAEDRWVPAAEPIHFDKPKAGVGPGLVFGKQVAQANPEAVVGLVPCAVGGTPIRMWQPGAYWKQTDSHPYDDMLRRARAAQEHGKFRAVLWHQGESDSGGSGAGYADQLDTLIERLRQDLGRPDLPVLVGGMSDAYLSRKAGAAAVDAALRGAPDRVDHVAYVSAGGLKMQPDDTHFDAESAREFGRRFAESYLQMQALGSEPDETLQGQPE